MSQLQEAALNDLHPMFRGAILLTQRVFDSSNPPAVHKTFWRDAYAAAA